ncbi:MAG TPA: bifunctional folylpolyglutamate synthase/dihydrofolate synthase [Candidatus Tripitaka sp. YC43]
MSRDSGFRSYREAVDFLSQGPDLERLTPDNKHHLPLFNLERVERLLAHAGSPQEGLKVVHVAGTKGKGSTASMIARFLEEAGYRVGLFTSPHLIHLEERIKINGDTIPKEEVCRLLGRLKDYVEGERERDINDSPTFFEILTALGLMYFSGPPPGGVDWAVLEVGMGGRLDATNVVAPRVSVITEIGMDHTEFLGVTLRQIALEKAGIIKEGVPVVSSPGSEEALAVVEERCREKRSPHYLVGRDIEVTSVRGIPLEGVECNVRTWAREYRGLRIPLLGNHQARNCACALGVMEVLAGGGSIKWSGEPEKPEKIVRRALNHLRCPARIEVVSREPLTILDSAHNVPSMRALAETLKRDVPFKRLILVLGLARDKDIDGILREIVPLADELILTSSGYPRAAEPGLLGEKVMGLFGRRALVVGEVEGVMEEAQRLARPGDCICVTGSFYLAGRVMEVMGLSTV